LTGFFRISWFLRSGVTNQEGIDRINRIASGVVGWCIGALITVSTVDSTAERGEGAEAERLCKNPA